MPILMVLDVPGATLEQYDRTNEIVGIRGDADAPDGLISHAVGATDDGLLIADVWESEEAFGRFFEERLGAALRAVGFPEVPPTRARMHNMIDGAGTEANVIMMIELDGYGSDDYDKMTAGMDAHAGTGENHPSVSHAAAVKDGGGLLIVDLWDSPESFGRFAESQIGPAGEKIGLGPVEPRFVPVHFRLRGSARVH